MYDSFISYTKLVERSQSFDLIKDTHILNLSSGLNFDPIKINPKTISENTKYLDLNTENSKGILFYTDSFYPYIMFHLGQILAFYSKTENRHIELIAIGMGNTTKNSPLSNFIQKIISDYGVKVTLYSQQEYNFLLVNNFYIFNNISQTIYPEILYNEVQKYVTNNNPVDKRVFVSRKIRHKTAADYDYRIDDDSLVEGIFKDLGFEIVYTENFESFVDQINYFSNVKVLAGVTGAGLTNAVFMPPGGTVIELSSILNFALSSDTMFSEVHEYYKMISLFKKHLYFSISNVSGRAEDFINNKYAIETIRKLSE